MSRCGPCEVCGGDPYAPEGCLCPECPECNTFGDPLCYEQHGLIRTQEQINGLAATDARLRAEVEAENAYYAKMGEQPEEEWN